MLLRFLGIAVRRLNLAFGVRSVWALACLSWPVPCQDGPVSLPVRRSMGRCVPPCVCHVSGRANGSAKRPTHGRADKSFDCQRDRYGGRFGPSSGPPPMYIPTRFLNRRHIDVLEIYGYIYERTDGHDIYPTRFFSGKLSEI